MKSRKQILQRLRSKRERTDDTADIGRLPPRIIRRSLLEEFQAQAEFSCAEVRRLQTRSELNATLQTLKETGASVTEAEMGIAETGSVALHSHLSPSADIYLCDHLVVCICEKRVTTYLHEALKQLVASKARAVHIMTGPSRTADVEQTIQIGAHGPRKLTIVVYP